MMDEAAFERKLNELVKEVASFPEPQRRSPWITSESASNICFLTWSPRAEKTAILENCSKTKASKRHAALQVAYIDIDLILLTLGGYSNEEIVMCYMSSWLYHLSPCL
jgi:hypothetical protein